MSASATHDKYRPETRLVQSGILRSQFGETSEALFLTQGYVYDNSAQAEARFKGEDPGYQYSRFANPTVTMFEQRIAEFEGAEAARATATGMAAVTLSLMGQVQGRRPRGGLQGDLRLLPLRGRGLSAALRRHLDHRRRQRSRRVAQGDAAQHQDRASWRRRPIRSWRCSTSPRSPRSRMPAGATLVVDNVFSTPLWQSPLALGADCVVYSTTKHIDGQGRCLGGVILGSQKFINDHIHTFIRQTGPSMSPFNAWVMLKGLETLAVRVRQQTDTAAAVAVALAEHPKVSRLIYPGRPDHPQAAIVAKQMRGGSTLVAFEIKGGKQGGVPLPGRAQARAHLQQSRRRQEPDHPSGDDDASAAQARAARRARHQRRHGAAVVRARASRRSDRGPDGGAEGGVRTAAAWTLSPATCGGGHRRRGSRLQRSPAGQQLGDAAIAPVIHVQFVRRHEGG